jgi:hypothetical protein
MQPYSKVTTRVILNGTEMPVINWSCNLSSAGSISHFDVATSIKYLQTKGIDVFSLVKNNFSSRIQIYVIKNDSQKLIFSGIVDQVEGEWHNDLLEIRGRDLSAILRDEFLALSDMQYQNQPISEIVKQIAQKHGFGTSKITETSQLAGTQYDAYQSQEYTYSDRPRSFWRTLQLFAQECGFIVYVTPEADLYFGQPGKGSSHSYYWMPTALGAGKSGPSGQPAIKEISINQQARRYSNFTVNVFATDHNNNNQQAFATTQDGKGNGVVYNKHPFGLSPENAQQYADAIAADLKRRAITAEVLIDGDASLKVNDKVMFMAANAGDLFSVSNQQLTVAALTHSFQMASYESSEGQGFYTHISASGAIDVEDEGG